jgi:hypothetical protein
VPDGFALSALGHALRFRIERQVRDVDAAITGNFSLVSRPPEMLSTSVPASTILTFYAYHLTPNQSWTQARGPAFASNGERRAVPWLALDIRFVLAAYGADTADAEMLLGLALLALHETPVLTADMCEAAANAGGFPAGSPLPQALRDLADQPAPIKIVPIAMSDEGLSQLWSPMNSGLRSGMAYQVSTLLMERRQSRKVAPPVREARLGLDLIRRPQIVRVRLAPAAAGPAFPESAFVERAVASPGERLRLTGSGLRGPVTQVAIGSRIVAPAAIDTAPMQIDLTLPGNQRPGLANIEVRHRVPKPKGELPPPAAGDVAGERSNLVPFAIRPVLAVIPASLDDRQVDDGIVGFRATIAFAVPIGARQRVELLLGAADADADGRFPGYSFDGPQPAPGPGDPDVAVRVLRIAAVPTGSYFVRVVVDGAESALAEGPAGYSGPLLVVPA